MGFHYVLINHTRKVIEDASLYGIWRLMSRLIREQGWEATDNVEMMFEENSWENIGKLVVTEGYKSNYEAWSFDGIVPRRQWQGQ
jgi:hypothetical protein